MRVTCHRVRPVYAETCAEWLPLKQSDLLRRVGSPGGVAALDSHFPLRAFRSPPATARYTLYLLRVTHVRARV